MTEPTMSWWSTPENQQPATGPQNHNYVPQSTIQYSTFIKRAIVEALQDAFKLHPTKIVQNTRVAVDFGKDRWAIPGIIVKFFERDMRNAGVGHEEWLPAPDDPDPENPTRFIKYYQRIYKGDISFDIWAASSLERDIVRDALVEVLMMQDTTDMGYAFLSRMYMYLNDTPYGLWNLPVLNLNVLTGYGENHTIAPWAPEDVLHYQVTYRVPIMGQLYSMTPRVYTGLGYVEEVDVDIKMADELGDVLEEDQFPVTGLPQGLYRI